MFAGALKTRELAESDFPELPLVKCGENGCEVGVLKTCGHGVMKVLTEVMKGMGKGERLKWLKEQRKVWHSDKVGRYAGKMDEGVQKRLEKKLREVFVVVANLLEEVQEDTGGWIADQAPKKRPL